MSRPTLLAALVLAVVLVPIATVGAVGAVGAEGASTSVVTAAATVQESNPCVRTVREEPERNTLISIQGARGSDKTDAMLVGFRPDGAVIGVHNADENGRWWAYDVDPLSNGNLLFSTTEPGISVVEELDPRTGEHVAVRKFDEDPHVYDSHDADLINRDELLMNDMKQDGEDRVLVYNLTREEIVWEYRFEDYPDQFPRDGGGEYGEDWTHNNDVEQIGDGVFMVSVRNYDQVVAINRSSKEIEWKLGSDDDHEILDEQHNPDYLESENGTATVLVADSLNDRVVEYARVDDGSGEAHWEQSWVARGGGFDEPRDADRLPNGNTLVADRRGHRLVEVTPEGDVVWEVFTPWQPYDAERVGLPDESTGPTMREIGAAGVHELSGTESYDESDVESCYDYLRSVESEQVIPGDAAPTPTAAQNASDGGSSGTDDGGSSDGAGTDGTATDESLLGTPSDDGIEIGPVLLAVGAIGALGVAAFATLLWRRR